MDTINAATNTNTTTTDPAAQGPRYRGAFTRLLQTIRSLSPDNYAPVNLDVMSSIRTTEGVLPKIANMKPLIAQLLPQFPMEFFDQLEDRALALGHAQTVYEGAQQPPAILQTLSDEATAAHDVALSEVNTQIKRGLIPAQALNSLKGGNGYRNLAADLFTLSETMRNNWDKISGRTTMTMEELDRMENLADQINNALGIREQMPELQAAAARDRQAAYSLFIEAYDEVRAAIAYVRRKEDDVDTIMPSLYAGRNGGKKKPVVDEPTKPTNPVVTQPTDNPVPPVVTPVVTPAAHVAAETKVESTSPTKPASSSLIENGPFMK
jgi:hypothetical protein